MARASKPFQHFLDLTAAQPLVDVAVQVFEGHALEECMLGGRRYKVQPTGGVAPNGHHIAGETGPTCTSLEGIHDLLLFGHWPLANPGINEDDYQVHPLDVDMSDLKLFHD
jgi:hypothetical protein